MSRRWRKLKLRRFCILVSFLLNFSISGVSCVTTEVPEEILKILTNRTFYNRHSSPTQYQGRPNLVNISMYIEGISSFQAHTMDFTVDIYFQERWIDERLVHTGKHRVLIKDTAMFELMWHPDLYFANARKSEFHDVTAPNFMVWIYQDGSIYYDCRISLTVMCMQNFAKFPLDSQQCKLRILSYAYDIEQLQIQWFTDDNTIPVDKNKEITMPDMHLVDIIPELRNDTYATGVWSCATAEFKVRREIMHHVLQSYVPTALIVVISWFSFWLDVDAVPGRVSLSITTLLTLATTATAARMALPQVSYIKAIDVWMGTCMGFVFGAMIEFTIVNYWARRKVAFFSGGSDQPKEKQRSRSFTSRFQRGFQCKCNSNFTRTTPQVVLDPRIENQSETGRLIPRYFTAYEVNAGPGSPILNANGEYGAQSVQWQRLNNESPMQETSLINRTMRNRSPLQESARDSPDYFSDNSDYPTQKISVAGTSVQTKMQALRRWKNRKTAQIIDQRSRYLFPLAFGVFNLVYWVYYLYIA